MSESKLYAVIMAGGSGTRFWPVSRGAYPKQLVRIIGQDTMIQSTVARLQPTIPAERTFIITTQALAEETRHQLPALPPENIIAEPFGRDTAACVCLASLLIKRIDPEGTMVMLPADHVISPADGFQKALVAAAKVAARDKLVTFGIKPQFPSTGYGYIHCGEALEKADHLPAHAVQRFVEKPDAETAQEYLDSGDFLWNSGMFIWTAASIDIAMNQHCPDLCAALQPATDAWNTSSFDETLREAYEPLEKISVDYALMEKANNIAVVTPDFHWDDVGSWDSLYDHLPVDNHGVILRGNSLALSCENSLIMGNSEAMVVGVGLEDITVIATEDAILVCKKGASQEVKQVVDKLRDSGRNDLI